MQSSEVLTPPILASTTSFPILSRSTPLSFAPSGSPTAPASGQGEAMAEGYAHSSSHFDFAEGCCAKVHEETCLTNMYSNIVGLVNKTCGGVSLI